METITNSSGTHKSYDDTLCLSDTNKGFYLYDTTRGMNLSMKAESENIAFFEALKYYQERLLLVETELCTLKEKVAHFVNTIADIDEEGLF